MSSRTLSRLDQWLAAADQTLRTLSGAVSAARPTPAATHRPALSADPSPAGRRPRRRSPWAWGSCRDSSWLLVLLLRHLGLAARFVSGYLIQFSPDTPALDAPEEAGDGATDLHAWCEVYLPGAGWLGLDPTSGLVAGEGHIPLACTPEPAGAAPVEGLIELAQVAFSHQMQVTRLRA